MRWGLFFWGFLVPLFVVFFFLSFPFVTKKAIHKYSLVDCSTIIQIPMSISWKEGDELWWHLHRPCVQWPTPSPAAASQPAPFHFIETPPPTLLCKWNACSTTLLSSQVSTTTIIRPSNLTSTFHFTFYSFLSIIQLFSVNFRNTKEIKKETLEN